MHHQLRQNQTVITDGVTDLDEIKVGTNPVRNSINDLNHRWWRERC